MAQKDVTFTEVDTTTMKNISCAVESFSHKSNLVIDHINKEIINPLESDTGLNSVPTVIPPSFNVASYVNQSSLLQNMVKLGVAIHQWDNIHDCHSWILKLNFEKDVQPVIRFLVDTGITPDSLGKFFTHNPHILKTSPQDLEVRRNYLESKKFTPEMIARICSRNPFWLLFSTEKIDNRLGFFQQLFHLTGNELRSVTVKEPRLITGKLDKVKDMNFGFQEEMGFEVDQIKTLLLLKPKLWIMNKSILVERFDYLHNVIKLDHETIIQFPRVLTCRVFRLRQRHEFLQYMNRNQYDPKLPNYVSPLQIISDSDISFAVQVAKSSIQSFNDFCKTL
nr:EOG090X0C5Y [Eurycercus lamellatus]